MVAVTALLADATFRRLHFGSGWKTSCSANEKLSFQFRDLFVMKTPKTVTKIRRWWRPLGSCPVGM